MFGIVSAGVLSKKHMKRIITLLTALSFFTLAHAQYDDKKGYVGISLGPSIPFADFASTDKNNDDAGYATTGGNLTISFAYRLGQHLGFSAMLSGNNNPVNESALESNFREDYPGADWNVEANNWKLGGLLLGGYATFPASEHLDFDIRLMLGILSSTSPKITATATSGGLGVSGEREEKTVTTPSFDIGFGIKYRLGNAVALLANADFISANPKFDNVTTTTTFGSSTSSFDQNYSTLNLTIGLGFLLK
jgi:hypothetical protein